MALTAEQIFLLNRMNSTAYKVSLGQLISDASDIIATEIALADGKILVGGATGIAAACTPSGEATMSNTGAFTIGVITTLKTKDVTTVAYSLQIESNGDGGTPLTANRKLTIDVFNADRTMDIKGNVTFGGDVSLTGTLTLAGAWTHTGAHTVGITTTGNTTITLPTSGTLITTTVANVWTDDQTMDNAKKWKFRELTGGGVNFVSWRAADALAADLEYIWPTATVDKGVLSVTAATGATAWALIVNDNVDNAAAIATSKLAAATQIGYLALGGTITTGGAWTQTGAHTIGITTTNATTLTLPTSGTLARISGETFDDVVSIDIRDVTTVAQTVAFVHNGDGGTVLTADRDIIFDCYNADRYIDLKGNIEFQSDFKICDQWLYASGTLTATQVRKLNAAPIALIATPGANKVIVIDEVQLFMDWASQTYNSVGGGDDILIEYASGLDICRIETTGFMDQGSDQHRYAKVSSYNVDGTTPGGIDISGPANDAINITVLTGELAAADLDANGDSPLKWKIRYKVIDLLA